MKITLKVRKLLVACGVLFSFVIVHQSCTKIDVSSEKSDLQGVNPTERFFKLPSNASPEVRRVAAEMQKRNDKQEFITKFVKDNGYPRWDKVITSPRKLWPVNVNLRNTSSLDGDGDEIIIPVVDENNETVSSFIGTTDQSDSSDFSLYRGADYERYGFNDVPEDSINADKAVLQIMLLDKEVFGYTKFQINDKRLFNQAHDASDPTIFYRIVILLDESSSNLSITCATYSIGTPHNHCPYAIGQCPNYETGVLGPCDNCEQVCASWTWEPQTICGPWETGGGDDDGGTPTPPGPGPSGPGGGGGGTPNPFPCPSSQAKSIPPAGCTPTNTPPPVNPLPTPDFLQILHDYAVAIHDAAETVFTGGNAADEEWGFNVVRKNGLTYAKVSNTSGDNGGVVIKIRILPDEAWVGDEHIHGDYDANSPDPTGRPAIDFKDIGALRGKGITYITSVNCGNVRYCAIVEDAAKAQVYFLAHPKVAELSQMKAQKAAADADHLQNNTPYQTATQNALINQFGLSSVTGIGIYISNNPEKTNFTKLN